MTGASKGFGFVKFYDVQVQNRVIEIHEHKIDGRTVMARQSQPRGSGPQLGGGMMGGSGGYGGGGYGGGYGPPPMGGAPTPGGNPPVSAMAAAPDFNPHKLFVGGIPHAIDESTFLNYFQQFGQVEESWLMYDPTNQRPRGFGFVVFGLSLIHI